MNKPYVICYMMTSVDGRIDCSMTGQLPGVESYYPVLSDLDLPTTVSGRVTAELEMALPGKFTSERQTPYGKTGFSKKAEAKGYEVVLDSKGTLLWEKETDDVKPHLILTSENVSKEYLNYLDGQNISWIACGEKHVDVAKASEILAEEFGVKRMGLVGMDLRHVLIESIALLIISADDLLQSISWRYCPKHCLNNALKITTGRTPDLHRLETCAAGRIKTKGHSQSSIRKGMSLQ